MARLDWKLESSTSVKCQVGIRVPSITRTLSHSPPSPSLPSSKSNGDWRGQIGLALQPHLLLLLLLDAMADAGMLPHYRLSGDRRRFHALPTQEAEGLRPPPRRYHVGPVFQRGTPAGSPRVPWHGGSRHDLSSVQLAPTQWPCRILFLHPVSD